MATNTNRHLSDMAISVLVDTANTVWSDDPLIENLQDVLNTLNPIVKEEVYATDTTYGLVKIAQDDDIESGVGSSDVITSEQLLRFNGKPLASYDLYGTTKYSTEDEVLLGTDENTSVNPLQLNNKFEQTIAQTDKLGTIKLSNESMVIPGIDNTTAMTPKLVKMAIDRLVPGVSTATEQTTGTVILANIQTVLAGKVREGYALSPYSFSKANATEDVYGTTRLASTVDINNRVAGVAISPKNLNDLNASLTTTGLVSLATEAEVKAKVNNTKAITPNALAFLLNKVDQLENQMKNKPMGYVPIGATVYSFVVPNIASSGFCVTDGRSLKVADHQELFALIGYTYGGSGANFNLPDTRGLYSRAVGKGKHITGNLSNTVSMTVGQVLRQQVLAHKHVGSWGVDDSNYFGASKGRFQGSGRHDWNNDRFWTNDGTAWNGNPNPQGQIGNENRPWTIGKYELMRIK